MARKGKSGPVWGSLFLGRLQVYNVSQSWKLGKTPKQCQYFIANLVVDKKWLSKGGENMDKNGTGSKSVGSQEYYGGIGRADGFGHGHKNNATGYDRPPIQGSSVENALGWAGTMGTAGKSNVNIGNGGQRKP
jgi:hypothetical protein